MHRVLALTAFCALGLALPSVAEAQVISATSPKDGDTGVAQSPPTPISATGTSTADQPISNITIAISLPTGMTNSITTSQVYTPNGSGTSAQSVGTVVFAPALVVGTKVTMTIYMTFKGGTASKQITFTVK